MISDNATSKQNDALVIQARIRFQTFSNRPAAPSKIPPICILSFLILKHVFTTHTPIRPIPAGGASPLPFLLPYAYGTWKNTRNHLSGLTGTRYRDSTESKSDVRQ